MRAMGLRRLVLVAPRTESIEREPEAVARASGARDVLEAARTEPTLAQALAPFTVAVAVSADTREFGPLPQPPEVIARIVHAEAMADPGHRIALVFGGERNGLSIGELQLCQLVCSIPGERDNASLNLSQAVQIIAYCLRAHERLDRLGAIERAPVLEDMAAGHAGAAATGPTPTPRTTTGSLQRLATQAQIAGLFEHLERVLIQIEFLDPLHPKKLMPRLRRLFSRTRLETEEVDLLRGVCTQIEKHARKR